LFHLLIGKFVSNLSVLFAHTVTISFKVFLTIDLLHLVLAVVRISSFTFQLPWLLL